MKRFLLAVFDWVVRPLILAAFLAALGVVGFGPKEWAEWLVGHSPGWMTPTAVKLGLFVALGVVLFLGMLLPRITRRRKRREILLRAEEYAEHTDGRLRYVQAVCEGTKSAKTWRDKLPTQRINLKSLLREIDRKHLSLDQIRALERLKISDVELDTTIDELVASANFTPDHSAHLYKARAERLARSLNDFIKALSGRFHRPQLVKTVHNLPRQAEKLNVLNV